MLPNQFQSYLVVYCVLLYYNNAYIIIYKLISISYEYIFLLNLYSICIIVNFLFIFMKVALNLYT
jgi:hypothetical protein